MHGTIFVAAHVERLLTPPPYVYVGKVKSSEEQQYDFFLSLYSASTWAGDMGGKQWQNSEV